MSDYYEPWAVEETPCDDPAFEQLMRADGDIIEIGGAVDEQIARRIAQCVTACAGLRLADNVPTGAVAALVEVAHRDLEWVWGDFEDQECIVCGNFKFEGHKANCVLAAALAALTGDDDA